mgnify:CR=1 FL=1|jgi:hypothetical protein
MKYFNSGLIKSVCFLAVIFIIQACDNEFSEIGTGIVGTPDFEIENSLYPVKTYNKKITPFKSNGLSENLLGYYYDPLFGDSKVHFVSQLTPKTLTPNFGDDTVLDSVVLTIPYASTANISEETTTYELDSLYGGDPIKLSVFKNNYYLRAFDPNGDLDASQNYYSNGTLAQGELMGTANLEGELIYQDPNFSFKAESIELWETNEDTGDVEVTSTLQPSLRLNLFGGEVEEGASAPTTLEFWEDLILSKEDDEVLSSSSNFYEYFRGLYFKAEPKDDPTKGSLIQLDFASSSANLTLYYKYENTTTTDGEDTTTTAYGTYEMNFTGNRVSIFENTFNTTITDIIEDTSTDSDGDNYLYLKGGEGSMAVVELFTDEDGNSEEDQLNEFREIVDGTKTVKRLINEAYLEFYVEDSQSNVDLPNRVYIYDLDNNIPLTDFFFDQTTNTASSDSKFTHLVPLSTETAADGTEQKKYKIRLTEHLNNIITKDSTNVKLGLLVSSNVGLAANRGLQNTIDIDEDTVLEGIPTGTILSPKSVVLHGNNSPVAAKRVKLNVYYTEPNN